MFVCVPKTGSASGAGAPRRLTPEPQKPDIRPRRLSKATVCSAAARAALPQHPLPARALKVVDHGDPLPCNLGRLECTQLDGDHLIALRDVEPGDETLEDKEVLSIFSLDDGRWITDIYARFRPELHTFTRPSRGRRPGPR